MLDYNKKAKALGAGFDSNPSPGNIKDGLITDAIKSAGAAKKGGTSPNSRCIRLYRTSVSIRIKFIMYSWE